MFSCRRSNVTVRIPRPSDVILCPATCVRLEVVRVAFSEQPFPVVPSRSACVKTEARISNKGEEGVFVKQRYVDSGNERRLEKSKGRRHNGLNGGYFFYVFMFLCAGLAMQGGGVPLALAEVPDAQTVKEANDDPTTLKKITVKGTMENAPLESHEISTEALERAQAKEMKDIFATDPSVAVGGGGGRNTQRIYLRGVEGSNLNITIDGAKQGKSLHQHRGDIGGIDPAILKSVEVEAGPGVDRGPGALGGSIRFETVDAQDMLDPGESVGARFLTGYSSAADSFRGSASLYALLKEKIGFLAHLSATDLGDYRSGDGNTVPNSAGRDRSYFIKTSLLDMVGHSLRVSTEMFRNKGRYLWGGYGSDMGFPLPGYDPVTQLSVRETYGIKYDYRPGAPLINVGFTFYYNDNSLENLEPAKTVSMYKSSLVTRAISEAIGGEVRNTFSFTLGPTKHDLTLGCDYAHEDGTAYFDTGVRSVNASGNLGVFVQERMSVGPLTFSAGARLDSYSAEYGPTQTIRGEEVSPSAGIEYEFLKGMTAFAGYGEAVRGSGIIPLTWLAGIDSSTNMNDGKPFEAERSDQIQGGLNARGRGLFLSGDRYHGKATVFQSQIKNLVERVDGGKFPVAKIWNNPNRITSLGYELRCGWGMGAFDTTLAYSHSKIDEAGKSVTPVRRKIAPSGDRIVWDSRWQAFPGLALGYTLTAVTRLTSVPAGSQERPGYVLHDIQAEWEPVWLPGLKLSLAVNNLLDKYYCEQTTIASANTATVPEPGRDVRITISYRF